MQKLIKNLDLMKQSYFDRMSFCLFLERSLREHNKSHH